MVDDLSKQMESIYVTMVKAERSNKFEEQLNYVKNRVRKSTEYLLTRKDKKQTNLNIESIIKRCGKEDQNEQNRRKRKLNMWKQDANIDHSSNKRWRACNGFSFAKLTEKDFLKIFIYWDLL